MQKLAPNDVPNPLYSENANFRILASGTNPLPSGWLVSHHGRLETLWEGIGGIWRVRRRSTSLLSLSNCFFTDKSCRFSANSYQGPLKTFTDP